jgi:hypothetical protein
MSRFPKWTLVLALGNPEKTHALFYEAAPFSKTVASECDVNQMTTRRLQAAPLPSHPRLTMTAAILA